MVVQTSSAMAENIENYLDALNDLQRKQSKDIPEELEQLLCRIAQNGEPLFPWHQLKPLVVTKLESVIQEYVESNPNESIEILPNVENIEFKDMRERLLQTINAFTHAPFTIQRLCELLTEPRRYYQRSDKFMRGFEKNVQVVSTVTSGGKRITNSSHNMQNRTTVMVNGISPTADSNGTDNGNHLTDKTDDPLHHPATTSSSAPSTATTDAVTTAMDTTSATPMQEGGDGNKSLVRTEATDTAAAAAETMEVSNQGNSKASTDNTVVRTEAGDTATSAAAECDNRTQSTSPVATAGTGDEKMSSMPSSSPDLGSQGGDANIIPEKLEGGVVVDSGRTNEAPLNETSTTTTTPTSSGTSVDGSSMLHKDEEDVKKEEKEGQIENREEETVRHQESSSKSSDDKQVSPNSDMLAQGDNSESESLPSQSEIPTAKGDTGSDGTETSLPQSTDAKPVDTEPTLNSDDKDTKMESCEEGQKKEERGRLSEEARVPDGVSMQEDPAQPSEELPQAQQKMDEGLKSETTQQQSPPSQENTTRAVEATSQDSGTGLPPQQTEENATNESDSKPEAVVSSGVEHSMEVDNAPLEQPTQTSATAVASVLTTSALATAETEGALPSVDAVPAVVPSDDALPSENAVPSEDAVRSIEDVPSSDAVPCGDTVPSVDAVPSADIVPSVDAVPSADIVPSVDAVPSADTVPSVDSVSPVASDVASLEASPSAVDNSNSTKQVESSTDTEEPMEEN